ncbi:MAG: glycosyltransferase [Clostridiales bacterium]|nr:glycosyltransferase [Clostridiales bacterium]
MGKDVREAVLNKPSNLTFAGYVDKVQLQAAHSGSDLFLFPSYEETEGIVVLEALAMKTPVLLRNIPVYADWLQNGINVRKADNAEEFRDIAVKMLERELPDLTEEGYEAVKGKSLLKIGGRLYNAYLRAEYLHGGLKFAPAIHKRV